MSWEERWQTRNTPWDAGRTTPALRSLVDAEALPTGLAIVPGCGAGYDVFALASKERQVIGIDVAPSVEARFEEVRDAHGVDPDRARLVVADFFAWAPERPVDLWWDYTFFCALPPALRGTWADKVDALLAEDGRLFTLLFPVPPGREGHGGDALPHEGPPYPVSPALARELLEPRFVAERVEPVEESHPGREGKEWLAVWRRA